MPAPADTLPPRYLDPEPIARGGMGEVLRATDQELGREVAVKVLAERFARDESLRRRFRREALAAARLSSNPNIVTVYDVGEHEGRPLIVMEYLPGGSLEQRVAGRTPCPPAQVLDWIEEAAAALDAAHAAGVVHRDVKPGNLLLDGRGHVQVADFGIASATGLDSFTQTGTILGTAGYLSPEQARGERATPASDRYSLAVVAWELLAGRRPFESDSPTAEAAAHAQREVPPIRSVNPGLPAGFDAVFRRALAKDPARRHESAAELVGDLRRALHDDAGDTWVVPQRAAAPPPPHRRRPGVAVPALAILVVALAGVAAALALTHRGGTPQARTVERTVTGPGRTVTAAPPASVPSTTRSTASGGDGVSLNNAGYAKMQQHDFQGALPLFEQAVAQLQGTGSTAEAYADYNLAFTRFALGQCTGVLALLDSSQRIQGHRPEIDRLRHEAQRSCGGGDGGG